MTSLKQRVVKDTMLYTIANYAAMVIGMLVAIATKAILGTVGAGYWAVIKVFSSYGEYSDLGTRNAMIREIPRFMGAGKESEAQKMENSAYAFTILASFVSSAVIAAIAFYTKDPVLQKGLWICAFLVIATQLYNFSLTLLRTFKKIGCLSFIIVLNMVTVGLFSVAGALWKGILGMAIGVCAATFVSALSAYFFGKMRFRVAWNSKEILRLIKIGFPMVIISYALVTFLSLDTLMIGKMIGIQAVGLYTIGLMSVQQIGSLGRFSQIILLPHIQERYGRTGSLENTAHLMIRATRVLAHVVPFLIAAVIFFVPVLVHYFIPKFTGGLPSMKILVMGYYFVAVNELSANAAFTADKQRHLIPFLAGVIGIAAILNFTFIRLGYGIEGVAVATSISYFLSFILIFSFAFSHMISWKKTGAVIGETVLLSIYFAVCVGLMDSWTSETLPLLIQPFLRFFGFSILFLPAFYRLEKEERLIPVLKNLLFKKAAVL